MFLQLLKNYDYPGFDLILVLLFDLREEILMDGKIFLRIWRIYSNTTKIRQYFFPPNLINFLKRNGKKNFFAQNSSNCVCNQSGADWDQKNEILKISS